MNCDSSFKNQYCRNLNDIDCDIKCREKNAEMYSNELSRNIQLKKNFAAIRNRKLRGETTPAIERAHTAAATAVNSSNNTLSRYMNILKANIENDERRIDDREHNINTKNNEIDQKNTRILRLNNQIENLHNEFLSNKQKIVTGMERNQYKRNTIIMLIILTVIMSGALAYLLINK